MTSPYVSRYFLRDSGTFSFNDYINICNGAFVYILLAEFLTLSQGNLDLEALLGGSLSVTLCRWWRALYLMANLSPLRHSCVRDSAGCL